MVRRTVLSALLAACALAWIPAASARASACDTGACGAPTCSELTVRVRPGMTRRVFIRCYDAVSASVASGPAHGKVTDVSTDYNSVSFTLDPDADAPRDDELTLKVQGHDTAMDVRVAIKVIPRDENQPPHCAGDTVSKRSDGTGRIDVYVHPNCSDPDGDPFVVEGGGPGTHSEAPKQVAAGDGLNNWPYRTATFDGHERAPIWATDELGARSPDAYLDVTVGPSLDRPATCQPSSYMWTSAGVPTVRMRSGLAARRFGIWCNDPDGDAFVPQATGLPAHGALAAFTLGLSNNGWAGMDQFVDATYVPADDSPRDTFDVTAIGGGGLGPANRMAIVKVTDSSNYGGGCGWSPAQIVRDVPGTVDFSCDDMEGDALTATVVGEPHHGTSTEPVLTPARFGATKISIPYVPNLGWTGTDCVQVVVDDGHGAQETLKINIVVTGAPLPPVLPVDPAGTIGATTPPIPLAPPVEDVGVPPAGTPKLPGGAAPAVPPTGPTLAPTQSVLQRVLETAAPVSRVKAPAKLDVWGPPTLSRRTLLRTGRAAGLLVRCARQCSITAQTQLQYAGKRRAGLAQHTAIISSSPTQPKVLWVTVDSVQRRALLHARSGRAVFRLRVQFANEQARVVQRALRIVR